VVDAHDVLVLQPGQRPRLAEEAAALPLAGVLGVQDHLQRHGAVQPHLPRPVDDPHPSAADLTLQDVAGDRFRSRRAGRRPTRRQGGHCRGGIRLDGAVLGTDPELAELRQSLLTAWATHGPPPGRRAEETFWLAAYPPRPTCATSRGPAAAQP